MIKVLVVEDSPTQRELLVHILNSDPDIEVIGTAFDGERAIEFVSSTKPDVITMDINLPKLDGLTTTRVIMETNPMPIIIVSEIWNPSNVEQTFNAMKAGAVTCLEKPAGIAHPDFAKLSEDLVNTIKTMHQVKVVRRWSESRYKNKPVPAAEKPPAVKTQPKPKYKIEPKNIELVVIGASTGGPPVLQTILSDIPKDIPVPILIVQHIAAGFLEGFREWLSNTTGFPVLIAEDNEQYLPGHIYLAPEEIHMGVGRKGMIRLSEPKTKSRLCPSIAHLFSTVADVCADKTIGIILSGMGKDGAEELKIMRDKGAITIAQDQNSSLVHSMPGKAIELGAAFYVLAPDMIAEMITNFVNLGNAQVSIPA